MNDVCNPEHPSFPPAPPYPASNQVHSHFRNDFLPNIQCMKCHHEVYKAFHFLVIRPYLDFIFCKADDYIDLRRSTFNNLTNFNFIWTKNFFCRSYICKSQKSIKEFETFFFILLIVSLIKGHSKKYPLWGLIAILSSKISFALYYRIINIYDLKFVIILIYHN